MSSFTNVEVVKEANIYFDGKVTSRVVKFSDGTHKTLGIMMPGNFEFSTDKNELIEIQSGEMDVLLPDTKDWISITSGQSFKVPANSLFKLQVNAIVDYCCSYL